MALTEERFVELMAKMTEKQNKIFEEKLVTKLDEVKTEMTGAIDTIAKRQDTVEKEQKIMKEQFEDIKEQLVEIKKTAERPQLDRSVPTYSEILQSCGDHVEGSKGAKTMYYVGNDQEAENKRIDEIIDLSRRTISLYPFAQSDIDFEHKRGAKDEDEAKLWAVQTFLRYEMNIKSEIQATFDILDIFPPAGDKWDRIFVTFSNITTVNSIFSFTRNMRREVMVDLYVPPQCKDRYKAVQALAYQERYQDGEKKNQTRIKWGEKDFILYRKALGTRHWSEVTIRKSLPPVDLSAVDVAPIHLSPAPGRASRVTTSPAPGRTRRDTSKRTRSSGSGSGRDQSLPKNRKIGDSEVQGQDTGRVVEEESYCPASPAPPKGLRSHLDSPVFSRNKNQTCSPVPARMNPLI